MRAVVIGLIPCWMSVDSFNVSSLYVLVTLHAVATAVFGPALTASVPSLVVPSQYTSANALLQITTSLGIIFGPALSGLGIAALSSQEVLCLNASDVRHFGSLLHSDPVCTSRSRASCLSLRSCLPGATSLKGFDMC